MKDAEKERMRVGKKNRIVRYAAMLFLTAAAVFAAPQKTFAEGNKTYPTGDLKPYAPKQMENEPETYEARGADYKGSDYQLYTTLEERVKTAMLAGEDWVDIRDLNIRTDTYDLSYFYGYSPYFPSELWKIGAWYGNTYYTELEIDNSFGTVEETQEVFQNVDRKLASIYKLVNNSMSEEQKAITIHDYLVSHAEYDYSYSNYTSYGVLMEGTGVCQSYAFAYMYIMNHLGIETHFLVSDPMNHSWDMIKIDGSYYNVDCTFDDPTWNEGDRFGAAEHTYFLRSTSEMENLGHTFQTKPYSCTSTKYSNVFWRNVESPVYFQSGKAYFIENESLNSYTLSDGTKKKLYTDLPYYYVSLARNGDFLYYNTEQNIYQYVLHDFPPSGEFPSIIPGTGENIITPGEKFSFQLMISMFVYLKFSLAAPEQPGDVSAVEVHDHAGAESEEHQHQRLVPAKPRGKRHGARRKDGRQGHIAAQQQHQEEQTQLQQRQTPVQHKQRPHPGQHSLAAPKVKKDRIHMPKNDKEHPQRLSQSRAARSREDLLPAPYRRHALAQIDEQDRQHPFRPEAAVEIGQSGVAAAHLPHVPPAEKTGHYDSAAHTAQQIGQHSHSGGAQTQSRHNSPSQSVFLGHL